MEQAVATGNALLRLCIAGDLEFVQNQLQQLRGGADSVAVETRERIEVLEQRMKSWEVSVM